MQSLIYAKQALHPWHKSSNFGIFFWKDEYLTNTFSMKVIMSYTIN